MNKKLVVLMTVIGITLTSAVAGMKNPIVGGQRMTQWTRCWSRRTERR